MLISDYFSESCSKLSCNHIALVRGNGLHFLLSYTSANISAVCCLSDEQQHFLQWTAFGFFWLFIPWVHPPSSPPPPYNPIDHLHGVVPQRGCPQTIIDAWITICCNVAYLLQCWAIFHLVRRCALFLSSSHCIQWPNDYDIHYPGN